MDTGRPTLEVVHRFLDRGGHWVVAQFVLFAVVFAAGLAQPASFSFPGHSMLGWAMAVVGLALALAATAALGRNLTPFPKPLEAGELIEGGPYRLVRHPIYTGVILIMVGFALAAGDLVALAVAVLTIPFFYAKTTFEEQRLLESYPSYSDYQRRVRKRIIPGAL